MGSDKKKRSKHDAADGKDDAKDGAHGKDKKRRSKHDAADGKDDAKGDAHSKDKKSKHAEIIEKKNRHSKKPQSSGMESSEGSGKQGDAQTEDREGAQGLERFPDFTHELEPSPQTMIEAAHMGIPHWLAHPTTIDQDASVSAADERIGLSAHIRTRCAKAGIERLFAVQVAVIPVLQAAYQHARLRQHVRDVCVSAPTGSGKTLAFVIPVVEGLRKRVEVRLRALVVLPTKELARQVRETFVDFCTGTDLRVGLATGDASLAKEQAALVDLTASTTDESSKVDILVCTPGRLVDHLATTPNFTLQNLEIWIMDEADRLLGEAYHEWLQRVQSSIEEAAGTVDGRPAADVGLDMLAPPRRRVQKLLFSATLTRDPASIARLKLVRPHYISVTDGGGGEGEGKNEGASTGTFAFPSSLQEFYATCPVEEKPLWLIYMLWERQISGGVCFTKSLEAAHRLAQVVQAWTAEVPESAWVGNKIVVAEYSSDLTAAERARIMRLFKKGSINLLVCSDLVARGLDIDQVAAVINYDVPTHMSQYTHRVGRTARAGRQGAAYTLVGATQMFHFKKMMKDNGHWENHLSAIRPQKSVLATLRIQYQAALEKVSIIYRAHSEEAVCYLLEVGDAKLLLDCGSFEDFSGEGLTRLQRVARQVDAVLLSHPDMAHLGAYPLAYSKYGLKCPAYATQATHMMGRLCLQDVIRTLTTREEFTQFDEADVDTAFENITALQYAQPKALPGKHADIVVTAHAAGHTIGGTVWTISSGGETVLYALDFNHMKEEHLNRSSLMEGAQGKVSMRLMKPTLLITGAYTALHRVPPRKRRVECFLDTVARAVRRGGNVLVPVDSAARVLELAYILNEWWARDKARRDTHALCLLAQCSRKTRSFAQSLAGWMGGGVEAQLADRDAKPFDLRHVSAVESIEELDRKLGGDSRARGRQRHAVVLASLESMSGFAQDLFVRWATSKKNIVILPQRGPPTSLARHLYTRWWDRTQTRRPADTPIKLGAARLSRAHVAVTVKKRVPLEGAELDAWRAQERRRREQEAARDALLKRKRDMLDDDDVSTASDSDAADAADRRLGIAAAAGDMDAAAFSQIDLETERLLSGQTYDLYVRGRGPVRGLYLVSKSYCMFPFQEKNRRSDDYGEIYDLETYMIQPDADDAAHLLDAVAPDADKPYDSDTAARPETRPTKPVTKERRVQLNCELAFVDMEGRADGTSVSNIVVQLMPKRLVIVHGTSASTSALADFCRDPTVEVTKEIYTPAVGEILNVSSGVNVYRMRLADALVKRVPMTAVQGCMVGFVSGRASFSHEDQTPVLEPDHGELANAWRPPMLVGDPRLSALRAVLERQGFVAHFDSEGTLVCNNAVAIKRASNKRTKCDTIKILGTPSPDFYSIRAAVYAHLTVL
ncbi:hypothetical protein H4R24_005495 [Coemansia sp. RSA 988]|nr:hypothetical protein H4R24_005495 [Coemansia sp. RSA 988]